MFLIGLVIILFILEDNMRSLGFEIACALIVSSIIVQVLKRTFSRNRPYWILKNLNTYGIDLSDYSFPSGHSAASFSTCTIIALNYPKIALFVIFIGFLVAISRIYLAVHYPTDVLAGIIIGVISSLIVHYKLYELISTYIQNNFLGGRVLW
ncbi:phosphatase PAP2 family protein [Anaerosphaera multitolerans]|nr:phosphatase PAP2 family protein [Anaerosphaera multitolerans]